MKTISLKLPESLVNKLDSTAAKRGESRSALLRDAIEILINDENGPDSGSCMDLAKDLAGYVNGPEDLSFSKRRMKDYGK